MRRGWFVLLVAPLLGCDTGTPVGETPVCNNDAALLTSASGASVTDTAQMLEQIYTLVGAVGGSGAQGAPNSIAELLTALQRVRDGVQANQNTVADALSGVGTLLGGTGAIYNQVNALTTASGLSVAATTQAVTALQGTSGTNGTLTDLENALVGVMTTAGASSLPQLGNDVATLQGAVASLQADANQLLTLTGATGDLNNVITAVTAAVTQLDCNATTLPTAISDVATAVGGSGCVYNEVAAVATTLGGMGALSARASTVLTTIGATSSVDVTTDLTAEIALIQSSASSLDAAIAAASTLLGGAGSTLAANLATLSSALDSGTNDATTKLSTQLAALENGATVLSTAIGDVDTTLGGSGTTEARATAVSSSVSTLLTDSGSAAVSDVTTLVNELKTCTNTTTMSAAQATLCPASLGGYAALSCPQGASGGSAFMVVATGGFTSFSGITSASNASGIVSLVFNDGTAGQTYSVDTTSSGINLGDGTGGTTPIATRGTVTLTNASSGNTITFVNTSGAAMTTASAVATGLQNTFVNGTMVTQNTCAGIAALDTIVGGSGSDLQSRLGAIATQINASPTNITADLNTALGTAGGSGSLQASLSAIDAQISASPTNITADLATALGNVESSASDLSTAIADVGTALGGTGTLLARAMAILTHIGASSSVDVTTDLAAETALIQSPASSLDAAIASVNTALGGAGSSLAANLAAVSTSLGGAGSTVAANLAAVSTSLGGTGSTVAANLAAVSTSLGGTGSTVAANLATLSSALDSGSGDATTKLSTQLAALENGATVLSTAINDVDTALGGSGTTDARATALSGAVSTLLTDSGSAALSDVTTLVNELKTCTNATTMSAAQAALCPASLGGYAALTCPQGAGGASDFMVVAKSGFTSFSGITSASNASGIVSFVFNDGTAGQTYSVDTTSTGINLGDGTAGTTPIATTGTVTLTNNSSGNTITFVNTSGAAITSANALATGLQATFVNATMVTQNTCAGIAALDAIVGGSGSDLHTRLGAIDTQINASPTNITADLNTAVGIAGGSGSLQASLSAIDAQISASPTNITTDLASAITIAGGSGSLQASLSAIDAQITASPTNIKADLATALGNVEASASDLSTAIGDVGTALGGTGTLLARASAILINIGASSSVDVTTDLAAETALIQSSASSLNAAIAAVSTSLGGVGSTVAANLATLSSALDSGSSDATTKLSTQLAALESGATVLSTAIGDVDTALGGSGTTDARATALAGSVSTLLTDSGSAALSDVTTLVNNFKNCTDTTTMSAAQAALCPASLGGYAALSCPQGAGGGSDFMVVAKSGFTSFGGITSASNTSGIVSLVFNDGIAAQTYSVDTTSSGINLGDGTAGTTPIATTGTVTLTNNASGNTITFINTSGAPITSATALATGLQATFVNATMVSQNTCAGIAALDTIVGGGGSDLETRLTALDAQINASPTNITNDVASAISSIDSSATVLSTAISTVLSMIGP